jgi:dephospho-CoA kinase
MLSIGLTGGIGSGKSLVAAVLEHMGYPVFYSDQEAKALYNEDGLLQKELIVLVGDALYVNGIFQKEVLSQALFNNPELKKEVEARVHPLVRKRFETWAHAQKSRLVFNEAAILFETGAHQQFDATVLVCAPLQLRIDRVKKRDGLEEAVIQQRIKAQWGDDKKRELASYIIENDGQPILAQIESFLQSFNTPS